MFLHAMDLSNQGFKKICIVSPDSDVVVIALYAYWALNLDELWVEFGVGIKKKWLPIHTYAHALGEPICHALPFWHAFTGCDTVSQFAGRGKKTAWAAWEVFPEVTKTFASIPFSKNLTEDDLASLQKFVVLMYSRTCPVFSVNKCRKYLFTKPPNKAIENCPPTLDSLIQHVKRAMLQSLIWMESLFNSAPIDITKYSWTFGEDGCAFPVWCTLQKASKVCKELVRCGCRLKCTPGKCSCKKNGLGLPCSDLCLCGGTCYKVG